MWTNTDEEYCDGDLAEEKTDASVLPYLQQPHATSESERNSERFC
jgi:hypothetical protein